MSWYSPLFKQAGKAVLSAARRELAHTTTGKLLGEVEWELRSPHRQTERLGRALRKYSNFGPRDALRELRGTEFGQFAREVMRYSRGDSGMRRLLNQFLAELGPAGRMIQALTSVQGRGEIDQLVGILQAFGFEVLPPAMLRARNAELSKRGLAAAQQYLEELGAQVSWPGDPARKNLEGVGADVRQRGSQYPFGRRPVDVPGQGTVLPLPMADSPLQRFPLDHPIVTGEMVTARSSNVHSFGYDIESSYLYVRFLGYIRGNRGPDGRPLRGGPGSLYRYRNVTPEEFLGLLAANSKGEWVWDHLRIRGTWSGHQKDYELVGVMDEYVPRKATVIRDPRTGQLQEMLLRRRVRSLGGGWLESSLPNEIVGEPPWGQVDRGQPDRGEPDRGLPDRGM